MTAENPKIDKKYNEITPDIFGFLSNKHIIFYKIIDMNEIEVIRILGAEMDLKNRIKE